MILMIKMENEYGVLNDKIYNQSNQRNQINHSLDNIKLNSSPGND